MQKSLNQEHAHFAHLNANGALATNFEEQAMEIEKPARER